jgi:hypothetical protein
MCTRVQSMHGCRYRCSLIKSSSNAGCHDLVYPTYIPLPGMHRYLGVTLLEDQPAIIMKLYPKGSLEGAITATRGAGLDVATAMR